MMGRIGGLVLTYENRNLYPGALGQPLLAFRIYEPLEKLFGCTTML
jgi:hypothetical protein